MLARLPTIALLLGIAGLIPFIGAGIAAVSATPQGQDPRGLLAFIGYGAVILSFLGGVHWGFVLKPLPESLPGGPPGSLVVTDTRPGSRLTLGVVPALVGWIAILTYAFGLPWLGLVVLIAGFLATVLTEAQLNRRGLMPARYMWLRWGLTIVVLMILVTVLTLRLIGATITV